MAGGVTGVTAGNRTSYAPRTPGRSSISMGRGSAHGSMSSGSGSVSVGLILKVQAFQDDFLRPIVVQQGSTVEQLLQAEEAIGHHRVHLEAFDESGDVVMHSQKLTSGMCIKIGTSACPPVSSQAIPLELGDQICLQEALVRDLVLPLDLPPGLEVASRPEVMQTDEKQEEFRIEQEQVCQVSFPSFPKELQFGSQEVLCQLHKQGLLSMLYPLTESNESILGLLQQKIDKNTRNQILNNQGMIWADDEIRFHLQQLQRLAPSEQQVCVIDPLLITSSLRHGTHAWIDQIVLNQCNTVVTVACVNCHWIPVVWRVDNGILYGFSYNASNEQIMLLEGVHQHLCDAWNCVNGGFSLRQKEIHCQEGCGPIAIDFLHHLVFQAQLCKSGDRLSQMHIQLRGDFVDSCDMHTSRPWVWGLGQDDRSQLVAILRQHGVSADDVDSRVDMLHTKLGKQAVSKAIGSAQPWKELKWVANQVTPPIQIIRPQELQLAISQRAGVNAPLGKKRDKTKGKGKGKGKTEETKVLDPRGLRIEDGIFETEDGQQLKQAALSDIGPFATGVVLATYQESIPYLQGGKPISGGGLVLAIVDPPADFKAVLPFERLAFPVVCAANSEPLIIDTTLVQLGKSPVRKAVATNLLELKSIATCVGKFVVFRDEWEGEWQVFIQHPLKCLIQTLGVLMTCEDLHCSQKCGRWHAKDGDEVHDPILEVWNRQWLTATYSMIAPAEADLYTVTLRLPAELEDVLQGMSGHQGIYIEPIIKWFGLQRSLQVRLGCIVKRSQVCLDSHAWGLNMGFGADIPIHHRSMLR